MNQAGIIKLPNELKGGFGKDFDLKLFIFVILFTFIYGSGVYYLSTIPIPEPTAEDIARLQEKFARLVLKEEPKKKEKKKKSEAAAQAKAEKKEKKVEKAEERLKEKKEKSAEERAAERKAAASERKATREAAAAKVANVGALAMIGGLSDDDDDDGEVVEDLLGSGGVQTSDLGSALSSLDGVRRGGSGDVGRRRGRRGEGAKGGGGVEDLLSGVGGAKSSSLARKGGVKMSRVSRKAISGKASKSANRSSSAINKVVKAKTGAVSYCLKRAQKQNPNLSGKVTVKFTIAAKGNVSSARVTSSSVGSKSLEQCIVKNIKRWKFKPIQESEGSITVTYPFVFTSQ